MPVHGVNGLERTKDDTTAAIAVMKSFDPILMGFEDF